MSRYGNARTTDLQYNQETKTMTGNAVELDFFWPRKEIEIEFKDDHQL